MAGQTLVARYGTRVIAAAALVGLVVPDAAEVLRPHIGNLVVTMLIVSLLRVDFDAFVARMRRPAPAIIAAGWITLVLPLLVLAVASVSPLGGATVLAVLFLFSAPPPIASAAAFAMLMGLDGAFVLAVMLIATVGAPLTAPAIASLFVADTLPIGVLDLASRLFIMIAIALAVATLARRTLGRARIDRAAPVLDTVSVLIATLFAIGAMDGVGVRLVTEPFVVLGAACAAFAFMLAQLALTYFAFRPFVGADAVAIAYAAGNRNAGLVIAALGVHAVSDTVWLYFALSQLPVFMFPWLLAPIGRRLAARTRP
ncbi:MAG: hypothetical protein AAF318_07970 [Pseudomonadota bacterium]